MKAAAPFVFPASMRGVDDPMSLPLPSYSRIPSKACNNQRANPP